MLKQIYLILYLSNKEIITFQNYDNLWIKENYVLIGANIDYFYIHISFLFKHKYHYFTFSSLLKKSRNISRKIINDIRTSKTAICCLDEVNKTPHSFILTVVEMPSIDKMCEKQWNFVAYFSVHYFIFRINIVMCFNYVTCNLK